MSVRNRSSYSSRHTERSRSWGLLRGAFVLLLLAILSFALGFFVLARIMPGERGTETPGNTAPSSAERSSSAVAPPQSAPSLSASAANASPAPRQNLPGPTIDPEDSGAVQQPDSLEDSSGESSTSFFSGESAPENSATPSRQPEASERSPFSPASPNGAAGGPAREETPPQSQERNAVQPPARIDSSRAVVSTPSEAVTRPQEPAALSSEVENSPKTGLFRVQVGAYSTKEAAEREAQRLTAQGLSANVQAVTIAGRALYRVQHGAFRNRANAEAARERLKAAGVDSTLSQSE